MASAISLSLFNGTTPSKSNSLYKSKPSFRLISRHIPSSYSLSNREISLKSRSSCNQATVSISKRRFDFLSRCGISSNEFPAERKKSFGEWVESIGDSISTAFPIWVSMGCLLGLMRPSTFNWVTPNWTIAGLTITMLGMGMTLTLDDLRGALKMPKELFAGFLLQYSIMPLSGYLVSKLLNLPSHYAAGLILVGCCPGGTASNIVTYIARLVIQTKENFMSSICFLTIQLDDLNFLFSLYSGNVALSVLMTATSTLTAVVMTPLLTAKLAKQYITVDAFGLLMSTLQVVLLPVLAGAFLNQYFQKLVKFVSPVMPPIAVGTVAVLCGYAIGQNSSAILMSGKQVVLASSMLHICGFLFGYLFSRFLGIDVASSRTISIEVGMQNSVLGVVLATQHFGNPLTAVPCAVSSVCHSIIGSVLAGFWRRSVPKQLED
ncbi:unnamed protein product [Cochlearia groenlandica]